MIENVVPQNGQKVTITVDVSDASIKTIDLSSFMGRGKKMFTDDAADYVKGLRENGRV